MELIWEKCRIDGTEGVRILRVLGEDGQVEIPEQVWTDEEHTERLPVLELADYAFSAMMRKEPRPGPKQEGMPAICGDKAESVSLPKTLVRIGKYGFYNCEKLRKLTFWSSIRDLGAGLFTGCRGVEELDVWMEEEKKSCLPEVLAELSQTLRLTIRDQTGAVTAKLLIPEFFEESVENTPARILVLETHGCGHRYRYCFRQTQMQMPEYDALFPYVCVEEQPETAAQLAWYRLWYQSGLSESSKKQYKTYLKEHPESAMKAFLQVQDMKLLSQVAEDDIIDGQTIAAMTEAASKLGQTEAVTVLMNVRQEKFYKHQEQAEAEHLPGNKKRKFEL